MRGKDHFPKDPWEGTPLLKIWEMDLSYGRWEFFQLDVRPNRVSILLDPWGQIGKLATKGGLNALLTFG